MYFRCLTARRLCKAKASLMAVVAADNFLPGPYIGRLWIHPLVSLDDVMKLARTLKVKKARISTSQGAGKAGITAGLKSPAVGISPEPLHTRSGEPENSFPSLIGEAWSTKGSPAGTYWRHRLVSARTRICALKKAMNEGVLLREAAQTVARERITHPVKYQEYRLCIHPSPFRT